MSWYYVDGGQPVGPVSDEEFQRLINEGFIRPETLVWREGMTNWQPFRSIHVPRPGPPPAAPPPEAGGLVTCSECGRLFPPDQVVQYGTAYICAGCKPLFLQKLREGVPTGQVRGRRSLPVDPEALVHEILTHGVEVRVLDCISRAWRLTIDNFGLMVGATLLVMLCMQAGGFIPFAGAVISLILNGPLMGGLYIMYLKLIRGEPAGLPDAFSGFSPKFVPLMLTFLAQTLINGVGVAPFAIYLLAGIFSGGPNPDALFFILMALGVAWVCFFSIALIFSVPLVADLELRPTEALSVSFRIAIRSWFSLFGLAIMTGVVIMLGLLAFCLGVFVATPVAYAAWMYAYEDIFGVQPAT